MIRSSNMRVKLLAAAIIGTAVAGAECNTVIELTQEHHIA